jgi:membrane-associated phospholipid phosphatase
VKDSPVKQNWVARNNLIDYSHIAFLLLAMGLFAWGGVWGQVVLHALLAAFLIYLHRGGGDNPRLRMVHKAYPVVLLPFFYGELGPLNRIASGTFYDKTVQGWEVGLFGQSPAMWLCNVLPFLWFSELLHICYLTYYFLFPAVAIYLGRRGRYRDFQIACWSCLTTMIVNMMITVPFPVKGPRPLFPDLPLALRGPVWHFAHTYVLSHAADGAAFPSSHCSLAVVTALIAYRYTRPIWIPIAIIAALIVIATVYCRFHYAVDAMAGIALAILGAWLGPLTYNRLLPPVEEG